MSSLRPKWPIFLALIAIGNLTQTRAQQPDPKAPEETAYVLLYRVIQAAPAPHWDRETCLDWLKEKGLDNLTSSHLISAADRYAHLLQLEWHARQQISDTQDRHQKIEQRRLSQLKTVNRELLEKLSPAGAETLAKLISEVRSGATAWQGSTAWSYYATTVTSNGVHFTSTCVAVGAGDTDRTISRIEISTRSPNGRIASAQDQPKTSAAQVTIYLPLCDDDVCEDGNFYVSTSVIL